MIPHEEGASGAGSSTEDEIMSASLEQGALGASLDLRDLHAANIARQAEWCPDQVPDLSFRGNELGGECGEAQNVIKKLERERQGWRGSRATKEDLADELADVVICADLCAVTAEIDLGAAVRRKFNATSDKQGLSIRLADPASAPASGAERMTAVEDEQVISAILATPDAKILAGVSDKHMDELRSERDGAVHKARVQAAIREAISDSSTVDFHSISEDGVTSLAILATRAALSLATPAPATPPGVPDSVRALLVEALAQHFHDEEHQHEGYAWVWPEYADDDGRRGNSGYVSITPPVVQMECREAAERITRRFEQFLATHPAGQSAGSGAAPIAVVQSLKDADWSGASIGNKMLIVAAIDALEKLTAQLRERKPAPDSTRTGDEGPCLRAVVEVHSDRTDTRLTFGKGLKHEGGCKAVEQAIIALRSELDQRDACPASAGPSNDYGETGAKALNAAILAQCASPRICSGNGRVTEGIRCGPCERKALEAALAARPAAPEAQGAWSFDMEAAPRDGTVILLWREGWGEPSAAYWGLAPMADGAGIATKRHPWVFLDSTNGVNGYEDGGRGPMAWHPMLDAPAPPASSGQGGR